MHRHNLQPTYTDTFKFYLLFYFFYSVIYSIFYNIQISWYKHIFIHQLQQYKKTDCSNCPLIMGIYMDASAVVKQLTT